MILIFLVWINKKEERELMSAVLQQLHDKTAATASSLSEGQVDIGKFSIKQVVNEPSTGLLKITNKH